jgi:plasmid stabilization system protein ParE
LARIFGEAVALLAEQPAIGAKYEGARVPGVRRLFLGRVGYFIYYKAENDTLHVLALWHASREHQPAL